MNTPTIILTAVFISAIVIYFVGKLIHFFIKSEYEDKVESQRDRADTLQNEKDQRLSYKDLASELVSILGIHSGCLIESTEEMLNLYLNLSEETKLELCNLIKKSSNLPLSAKGINELIVSVLNSYKKLNNKKQYDLLLDILRKCAEKL